jgi:hypothetical protein
MGPILGRYRWVLRIKLNNSLSSLLEQAFNDVSVINQTQKLIDDVIRAIFVIHEATYSLDVILVFTELNDCHTADNKSPIC